MTNQQISHRPKICPLWSSVSVSKSLRVRFSFSSLGLQIHSQEPKENMLIRIPVCEHPGHAAPVRRQPDFLSTHSPMYCILCKCFLSMLPLMIGLFNHHDFKPSKSFKRRQSAKIAVQMLCSFTEQRESFTCYFLQYGSGWAFWFYFFSVACVDSAWHFLLLTAGGTTAVIKAGAISSMTKIGLFSLRWSNILLAMVLKTL